MRSSRLRFLKIFLGLTIILGCLAGTESNKRQEAEGQTKPVDRSVSSFRQHDILPDERLTFFALEDAP
jgi:hypothetical protein